MKDALAMTKAEADMLTAAVVAALGVSSNARTMNEALVFELTVLREQPASAKVELRELLSAVQSIPALEIFAHARQCALGHEERVDPRFLAGWLISRGQIVGAEQSVADLGRYLAADSIEIREILAVDGFDVFGSVELGAYELMGWNQVPMTDSKWRVLVSTFFRGGTPRAALVRRHKIEPVHLYPWRGSTDSGARVPIEPALDVLRCVTATTGAGIRRLHYWFEPEEWAPWAVYRSSFGFDSNNMDSPASLDESQILQLRSCVSHFMALEEGNRSRLRVPLDRLNGSYLARMRSVDVAIELGIALESLYAPSKLSEGIGYAVRTRAARFLGGSIEERNAVVKRIKDVYDLRSRAVHAGRFDAGERSKKWSDEANVRNALEEGQGLVGKSLVKIIQEGEPNWEDFDIGTEVGHS